MANGKSSLFQYLLARGARLACRLAAERAGEQAVRVDVAAFLACDLAGRLGTSH